MKKQHALLGLLAALAFPLAVLGAGSVNHAAPAPRTAPGAPVKLRLSVERAQTTTDAQGRPHAAWAALGAGGVHPGDVLRYSVLAENTGAAPVTGLVVTQPVPAGTAYVARSAEGDAAAGARVSFSLDKHQFSTQPLRAVAGADGVRKDRPAPPESYAALRWRFPALAAKATLAVFYQVRVR